MDLFVSRLSGWGRYGPDFGFRILCSCFVDTSLLPSTCEQALLSTYPRHVTAFVAMKSLSKWKRKEKKRIQSPDVKASQGKLELFPLLDVRRQTRDSYWLRDGEAEIGLHEANTSIQLPFPFFANLCPTSVRSFFFAQFQHHASAHLVSAWAARGWLSTTSPPKSAVGAQTIAVFGYSCPRCCFSLATLLTDTAIPLLLGSGPASLRSTPRKIRLSFISETLSYGSSSVSNTSTDSSGTFVVSRSICG